MGRKRSEPKRRIRSSSKEMKNCGRARIALTAGAAAQLVVDAAGLVALGADDVQTAQLDHLVVPLLRLDGILGHQVAEDFARLEHLVGDVLVEADGVLDDQLVVARLAHLLAGEELGVAAQQNVRAAAGHVGGDGHRADLAGLSDDLGLLFVELRVQNHVGNAAQA